MHNIPKKLPISNHSNINICVQVNRTIHRTIFYEHVYMFVPNEGLIHTYKYNINYSYTIISMCQNIIVRRKKNLLLLHA